VIRFELQIKKEKENMRYKYEIVKSDKSSEILQAMSFKKLLKQVALKYPNELIWVTYKNKKKKLLNKIIDNRRVKKNA
jgi:hypothetical protein